MFQKVIVGVDGQDGGRAAIALAQGLAPGAQLTLVSSYPYDDGPSRAGVLGYANLLREEALALLEAEREAAGLAAATVYPVADPSPAKALRIAATELDADLIVLGSPSYGPVGRLLLGDVSRATLYGAPCPVAVAPQGYADAAPPLVIGVAYDESAEAVVALTAAVALAKESGASLKIVEAIEEGAMPAIWGFQIAKLLEDLQRSGQETLDRVAKDLPVPATASVQVGRTREILDALAADVDLVVCGSRGWGPVARVTLGSTADRLIHCSPSPVLVVPRGAEAEIDPENAEAPAESTAAA